MNIDAGQGICENKLSAMIEADLVVFGWKGETQHSIFDLGMAFALNKWLLYIGVSPLTVGVYDW